MIYKEVRGNELYVWSSMNGKFTLLYKRWLKEGIGKVFCNVWGHYPFNWKDVIVKRN